MDDLNKPDYTEVVLSELERMRQTSIQQYYKTDLYQGEKIESVIKWYEEVKKCVKLNLPKCHIKTVVVYESLDSVISVDYEYGEIKGRPSFRFVTETRKNE